MSAEVSKIARVGANVADGEDHPGGHGKDDATLTTGRWAFGGWEGPTPRL